MTIQEDELVERFRRAAELAEKKYVANSPELFNLAADHITALSSDRARLVELLRDCEPALTFAKAGGYPDIDEIVNNVCAALDTGATK